MGSYEYWPPIMAEVLIEAGTVNLAKKAEWLVSYIWLPEGYDVNEINPTSIMFEGQIAAGEVLLDDQQQLVTAMFSLAKVVDILEAGDEVEVTISGKLTNRERFEGTDVIRVIDKGRQKPHPNTNVAPEIFITSPEDNDIIDPGPTKTIIEAQAVDIDGNVVEVRFFVNDILVGIDQNKGNGWSSEFSPGSSDIYTITAVAIDNNRAETVSQPIVVDVSAGTIPR